VLECWLCLAENMVMGSMKPPILAALVARASRLLIWADEAPAVPAGSPKVT